MSISSFPQKRNTKPEPSPLKIEWTLLDVAHRGIEIADSYIKIAERVANGAISTSEARAATRALDKMAKSWVQSNAN
jgi:hypothetical protein